MYDKKFEIMENNIEPRIKLNQNTFTATSK